MHERQALTPGWLLREVTRLGCDPSGATGKIALAVSGGADSLALLWLAGRAAMPAYIFTVDHGLRPEAGAECDRVLAYAGDLGLPAERVSLSLAPGGNVQARAREARYRALGERCRKLGIGFLLTAHHQDDQAETLLLRLARGSGIAGLSAIRAQTEVAGAVVLRPLLGRRRSELSAIVTAAGWTAASDPSNQDRRYDRTRARALLAETRWLAADRLAAASAHLQQAAEALDWAAERAWDSRSRETASGQLILDPEGLPAELRRRLLASGLSHFGAPADGPRLAGLLARLEAGSGGTLGAAAVRPADGQWILSSAPARRPAT